MSTSPWPWKIVMGDAEYDEADRVYGIEDAEGKTIVETDTGVYPPKIEDARLMVEAPAMREALRNILGTEPETTGCVGPSESCCVFCQARVILKRVEG